MGENIILILKIISTGKTTHVKIKNEILSLFVMYTITVLTVVVHYIVQRLCCSYEILCAVSF